MNNTQHVHSVVKIEVRNPHPLHNGTYSLGWVQDIAMWDEKGNCLELHCFIKDGIDHEKVLTVAKKAKKGKKA